ncbi:MAG TPA: M28 family peptidase [Ktedonosporobacter sp.]|nr:M28 family peptidase [Ktedonosporobacter sp.]
MLRNTIRICCLCLFAICCFPTAALATTSSTHGSASRTALADFPTVDPNYIYDQLFTMVTRFQGREAGYDPPTGNTGHTGFADYWTQEATHDLQGLGAQVRRDTFAVPGWRGRPATSPAFNVEVSVPGAVHPEQVVVIGCHYDGEAISTQSANDDGSGCAIELGVAKAMGEYWRSHHSYPARTLRFVIFDAEEQGLNGSAHYVSDTVNGDLSNIVAMFNEEQSGIAYPLRYLGQLKNPLLPFYADVTPLQNSNLYPNQDKLTQQQRDSITRFRTLMQQAVLPVFQQFQALGYAGLTYHGYQGSNKADIAQPIFTPDQISNIHVEDDTLGSSDQMPFTLAGLPCATFAGNSTYYERNPPAWSYPFDQHEDTIQLMNTFADGSSQKSNALMLALALPGMLTTWMLNQPDILGQTASSSLPTGPLVAISDVGKTLAGQSLTLDAKTAFDPQNPGSPLTYAWDFGDGSKATGSEISHTYTTPGDYTLTLTASSSTGTRHVSKTIHVVTKTTVYDPYGGYQPDGNPPHNPAVVFPTPDDTLSDKVISSPIVAAATATTAASQPLQITSPATQSNSPSLPLIIGIAVLILAIIGAMIIAIRRISRPPRT